MKKIKLKDQEHMEAIIKITRVREHFKEGNLHSFKDKLICIRINTPPVTSSTCLPDTFKGKRNLIKFIKDELGIR